MVYLLSFIHSCRNRWGRGTNVVVYLHVSWIICMYHELFVCTIYDSLGCVLYMNLIVFIYVYYGLFAYINLVNVMPLFFTVFSFHLPIFCKNHPVSGKIRPESPRRFSGKTGWFIGETGRISVFPVFTVPLSSLVHFSQIFLNFTDFFSNFTKTDGIGQIRFSSFRRFRTLLSTSWRGSLAS
jgi:hypothetical protein